MQQTDQHYPEHTTSIILAEDHHVVRSGIRALLEKQPELKIVGEAENGDQVITLLASGVAADVVITDINMPGMGGIQLIEKLASMAPKARLIVLSMLDNDKFVSQAFNAGATGYLLKNISSEELVFAVKHVLTGGEYVCAEIAMRCMKRVFKVPELPKDLAANTDLELSARDVEVLHLIAEGYTNQEIADKIFTGKRTVEGYRQQLMNKTGSRNTAALIKFAILNGLIS